MRRMLAACKCRDSIEGDEVEKDEIFIKVLRGRPVTYVQNMKDDGSSTSTTMSFQRLSPPLAHSSHEDDDRRPRTVVMADLSREDSR